MPDLSFTNPPPDFAMNVGYQHRHIQIPCDKKTAIWFEGMVGFDLQALKGYTVEKATFLFHTGKVENLYVGGAWLVTGINDAEVASNVDCSTGIVVAEGYTTGVMASTNFATPVEGSMWYGSQQVVPGPFGGYKAQDVTQFVLEAIAANKPTLGFIFTADHSRPEVNEICFSIYDKFSLSVQLAPK
jgi:hypothetical protein